MADFLSGIEDSLDGVALPGVGLGTRRRDGWPERRPPRLVQLMNQNEAPDTMGKFQEPEIDSSLTAGGQMEAARRWQPSPQVNDGGTAVPPFDNRIEDDPQTRHNRELAGESEQSSPIDQEFAQSPTLLRQGERAEYQPGGGEGAAVPGRLIDQMLQRSEGPAARNARLAEQMYEEAQQPHGIDALHATAKNPFFRGLEKFGIGALRGLDVAGTMVAPGWMTAIPGTRLNELVKRGAAQRRLNTAVEDDLREAQAENYRSEAATRQQKPGLEQTAAGRRQLAEEYGLQGQDAIRYILTGQMPVAADKPNLAEQSVSRRKLADQYGLQGDDAVRYILTGQLPDVGAASKSPQSQFGKVNPIIEAQLGPMPDPTKDPQGAAAWGAKAQAITEKMQTDPGLARMAALQADKPVQVIVNGQPRWVKAGDAIQSGAFAGSAAQANEMTGQSAIFSELHRNLGALRQNLDSLPTRLMDKMKVYGGMSQPTGFVGSTLAGAVRGSMSEGQQNLVNSLRTTREGITGFRKFLANSPLRSDTQLNLMLSQLPDIADLMSGSKDEVANKITNFEGELEAIEKRFNVLLGGAGMEPAGPGQQLKDQVKQNAGGAPAGMVRFQDSQGGVHDIPRGNLEKARKRDPGLQVLGQ